MKLQYVGVYERELSKLEEKSKPLKKFEESLVKVEEIYREIKTIMSGKTEIELLSQMHDIVQYIDNSSAELKRIFNA